MHLSEVSIYLDMCVKLAYSRGNSILAKYESLPVNFLIFNQTYN